MVTTQKDGPLAAPDSKALERPDARVSASGPKIGILALQGDFARHAEALAHAGYAGREIRRPEELEQLDGLVIPGGESTTMLKFFGSEPWEPALRRFVARDKPILATCAGAILLAHRVTNPPQRSLDLIDMDVRRNAYGRQVDSFIDRIDAPALGGTIEAVFIRAPKIDRVGSGVQVLAWRGGDPVLVRQGRVLAATFHPELTEDTRVHRAAFGAETP
jgi:pyridoxal 5'-phosphate synthase pdxT subunit